MTDIISHLEYNLSEFTESEQRIALYFLSQKEVSHLKIVDVSKTLYVSTATISRFVNKIGFENYKAFLYELQKSVEHKSTETIEINTEAKNLWNIHHSFFERLYANFATLDLNYIANRLINSSMIYIFGFGKTQETANMMIYRLENHVQSIRNIPHFEHLIYTINNVMTYQNVLLVFYQHEYFKNDLELIIAAAKQKYVPIIILTLSADVDNQNYANVYKLYPHDDDTIVKYSTTMYTPFLLFADTIYMALNKKAGNLKYFGS